MAAETPAAIFLLEQRIVCHLNMSLRKVTKDRGHFPSDEAMFKLLYLALKNIAKKWTMPFKSHQARCHRHPA